MQNKDKRYDDSKTVEKISNEIIPEEFPEGPVGSVINEGEPVRLKSTEWDEDQKQMSAYDYPDEEKHKHVPRQYRGADPLRGE